MMQPLNEADLVKIQARLIVPVIVKLMLQDMEPLDQEAEFTMHEMIAEMEPDTAALCIALSAAHIVDHCSHIPIAGALGIDAAETIECYAPLWLAHAEGRNIDTDMLTDKLQYLPEYLEALGDMLGATKTALHEEFCAESILCDIMALQADIHKVSAEQALGKAAVTTKHTPSQAGLANIATKNIIPFPVEGHVQS